MSKQAIDRYAAGAGTPGAWIKGLTREDLLAVPVAGKWSIQTLVHHVLDSDLIASHRMKRIIAEEAPLLISYDENLFAARLGYEKMDVALACELFRLNRELTAQMLRAQPESVFERTGIHSQNGKVKLADIVASYTNHLDHHLPFLVEKRKRLGKPM